MIALTQSIIDNQQLPTSLNHKPHLRVMEEPLTKCLICGGFFKKKGMATHKVACKRARDEREDEARYIAKRSQSMWIGQ